MYHELGVRGTTASDIRAGSMYSTFYNKNDQTIDSGKVRGTDHFAVQSERLGER
jgi:outer membrane lipoprotein SlyB